MTHRFKVGDKVVAAAEHRRAGIDSRVFTVVSIGPKNYKCSADDGGRGLSYPDYALEAYDPDAAPAVGVPYVPIEHFELGTIVTLKRAHPPRYGDDTPMVVVGGRGDKVNVTKVGGDRDSYLRVPPAGLVRRDIPWLYEQLRDGWAA